MSVMGGELQRGRLQAASLWVLRDNESARRFYEKLGFKNVGEQITDVGNGFVMDDFLMEKNT